MSRHFKEFQKQVSWFNHKQKPLEIFEIESFDLTTKFRSIFPNLSKIIDKSHKTGVELAGKSMVLFTWEIGEEISGWMCQFDSPRVPIIREHRILIDNIGGIMESFNGPISIELEGVNYNQALNLNQRFMFTGSMCSDFSDCDWFDPYLEWCEKIGASPIDISNSTFFTREANGDNFFYDRSTKDVLLFAHDAGYQFIEPVANQPNRSLYTINGVRKFDEFVELLGKQWLSYIEN